LSVGDILRKEADSGSDMGKVITEMIKDGAIVPVEITLQLLLKKMGENATGPGFLIDGFPREIPQAEKFEDQIGPCRFVLYFECSEEILEKRLLKRGETSGRSDDNIESVKKRFKTFIEKSYPVVEYFVKKDRLKKISSEQSVDGVYKNVQNVFSQEGLCT